MRFGCFGYFDAIKSICIAPANRSPSFGPPFTRILSTLPPASIAG